MPRGDRDKYFNAVISLFRRAHCVEKGMEGTLQMKVAGTYRAEWGAISELWFLGMQGIVLTVPFVHVSDPLLAVLDFQCFLSSPPHPPLARMSWGLPNELSTIQLCNLGKQSFKRIVLDCV